MFEARGKRIGGEKNMCAWVGLGWVWRRRGMGEGEGGSECKGFFLFGGVSFVLYFSKWGGVSFFSELLVSTGL